MLSPHRPQTLLQRASSFVRQTKSLDAAEAGAPAASRESLLDKAANFFGVHYSRGEFADPPSRRAYPLGPKIFSPEHRTLIKRLRDECENLSKQIAATADRARSLDSRLKSVAETGKKGEALLADMRSSLQKNNDETLVLKTRLRGKDEEIARLTAELAETHAGLSDLDRSLSTVRAKRRSWMPAAPVDLEALGVPSFAKGKAKEV